jgi:hypothetical protein
MKPIHVALALLVLLPAVLVPGDAPGGPVTAPAPDPVGGISFWCAAALVGGVAAVLAGSVPGAVVSGAAINAYC